MLAAVNDDAMPSYRQDLRIVPAALGDDSGVIGAAILVHEARSWVPSLEARGNLTARRGPEDVEAS
jgi:hypothetical protein